MVVLLLLHAFAALSSDTGLTAYNGPVWWKGLLASFYGGFVEEVQCRLFLVSLLVWLGARTRSTSVPGTGIYWIAIVLAAVIFGIGHLPILAQTTVLTTGSVLSTIGLNALCGVVFGWLFWRHGLEHSMLAHFSTDLVLHVVAPAFG
jgi:membrane protease YdiL (CAAX protease family)